MEQFPTTTIDWRYRVAVLDGLERIREALESLTDSLKAPSEVSLPPAGVATQTPRRGGRRKRDDNESIQQADAPKRRRSTRKREQPDSVG